MSDQTNKTYKTATSRVGQILLISLSVLIIVAAVVWYETHLSTALLKTILYVGVSGGVGGAAYGIRGFTYHVEKNDFNSKWTWWYFYHPITGFIYAIALYLLVVGGLITVGTVGTATPNLTQGILLYCAVGFLAGFASTKFNQKLDDVASTLFSVSTSTTAGSVASLEVSGFPAQTTVGTAGTFNVTAKDNKGNTVSGYNGKVALSSTDSQANLQPTNYTFQASDKGSHSFIVTFNTVGTQTIFAVDSGNSSIAGAHNPITVDPTPPPIK